MGTGRGLIPAQVAHAAIKERTSASIVDHQNCRRMKSNVRVIHWQVNLEEWAQTSTLDCTASGTNKRLGDQYRGLVADSAPGVPRTPPPCESRRQDVFGTCPGVLGGSTGGTGHPA